MINDDDLDAHHRGELALEVYPNPFNTTTSSLNLSIMGLSHEHDASIDIRDGLGRVILTRTLGDVHGTATLDLTGNELPAGVYSITLRDGDESVSTRLVVQ